MNTIRRINKVTLTAVSAALLCMALVLPANAAIIIVDDTCSLSDAIRSANDNVSVEGCTAGGPVGTDYILLTQDVEVTEASVPVQGAGLPVIISDITILGLGHSITRNSGDLFRIFTIGTTGSTAKVLIQDTTIRGGSTTHPNLPGGGIYVEAGSFLYLVRCTVSGNSANSGGGIYSRSTVDIKNSLVTQNTAAQSGAGLDTEWSAAIYNSTFSGNTLTAAASSAGIAVHNSGQASVSVGLSTFSGNSSNSDTSSTLKGLAGSVSVKDSIIANTAGGGVACLETTDHLLNKDDDGTCGGGGDLTGLDPVLADNGGPTQTHALLAGSNAIDHAGDCGELQDQRGFPREQNLCDSGAYEFISSIASVSINKSATPETYETLGDIITYSFIVENTGDLELTDVQVTDPLPGLGAISCDVTSLAPTDTANCEATYTIDSADVTAGSVDNQASVTAKDPSSNDVTADSNVVQITLVTAGEASVSINKSATPEIYKISGDIITYSFIVENTGDLELTDVQVTDPLPGLGQISCDVTSLMPTDTANCEATYGITPADVAAGIVTNQASVTAKDPSNNDVTADSNQVDIIGGTVECFDTSWTIPDGTVFDEDKVLASEVSIDTETPATLGVTVEAPNTLILLAPSVEFNQLFQVEGDADNGGQVRVIIGSIACP